MSDQISSVSDLQKRVKGERIAMVSTIDDRGTVSGRPVTIQRLDDQGDLWFLVDKNADWVSPADSSPIGVTIVDDGDTWVSFAGRAELVSDASTIEDLSGAMTDAFFEDGAVPVALRVQTDRIEWWTAPGKVAQVVQLAKAKVTDSQPDLGASGTLEV